MWTTEYILSPLHSCKTEQCSRATAILLMETPCQGLFHSNCFLSQQDCLRSLKHNVSLSWVSSAAVLLDSCWQFCQKPHTQVHTASSPETDGGCILQRPWMWKSTGFLNAKRHSVFPLLPGFGWGLLYLTSFIPPYLAIHFYSNNQCSNQILINPLMSPFGLQLTASISSSPLTEWNSTAICQYCLEGKTQFLCKCLGKHFLAFAFYDSVFPFWTSSCTLTSLPFCCQNSQLLGWE